MDLLDICAVIAVILGILVLVGTLAWGTVAGIVLLVLGGLILLWHRGGYFRSRV